MLSRSAISRNAPATLRSVALAREGQCPPSAHALLAAYLPSYQVRTNNFSTTRPALKKPGRQGKPSGVLGKLFEANKKLEKMTKESEDEYEMLKNKYKAAGREDLFRVNQIFALIMTALTMSAGVWVVWKSVTWVLRQVGVLETTQSRKPPRRIRDPKGQE